MIAQLEAEAPEYDFFQALRLIELAQPDRPRLGKARRGRDEALRLSQKPQLNFPTSSLSRFEAAHGGKPARLEVLLIGLFGPNGPLPLHLTTHAIERRDRHADRSFLDFCSFLQHRLLALYYRAWADARPQNDGDRFRDFVAALCGHGLTAQRRRTEVSDNFKLRHAGILAQQTRHPDTLVVMLRNLLGLPLRIQEFIGGWLDVPPHVQTRLGYAAETGGLGSSAVIGRVTWQCQHRFRLHIGPLDYADYKQLLPGGRLFRLIGEVVRSVLGDEFEWDLRLILKRQDVPTARLDGGFQAGWTAWLAAPRRAEDARDLTLPGELKQANPERVDEGRMSS